MKETFVHRLVSFSVRRSWIVILIALLLSVFLGFHALHIRVDADIRELETEDTVLGSINPFNFLTFQREGRRLHPVTAAPGGRAPINQAELQKFKELLLSDPLA